MPLYLIGLNHRTAPIEVRERIVFPLEAQRPALEALRDHRRSVNEVIEPLRRDKTIGSSLEAAVVYDGIDSSGRDLAELFIVSSVSKNGSGLSVTRTAHHKCGRCWRHLPDVTSDGALCSRCDNVVGAMEGAL